MKANNSGQTDDPQIAQVLHELAEEISKVMGSASEVPTAVPGLTLYQNIVPTAPNPCTYVPSLLLIPQGKKRVDLGKQSYVFGESTNQSSISRWEPSSEPKHCRAGRIPCEAPLRRRSLFLLRKIPD